MTRYGTARQSFYFQFITTPTADTPGAALYLHFDNKRYLFGQVAEGTQRACIQRGVGLRNIRNIFVTGSARWTHHGGLIGLILTLSDVQRSAAGAGATEKLPLLTIHGAPGLMHTLTCARRFVFRTGMPLSILETFPGNQISSIEPTWSDENVQVWAIPVRYKAKDHAPVSEYSNSESDGESTNETDFRMGPFATADAEFESTATYQKNLSTEKDQCMRKSIISDMFDSDWRRDRLVEVPFGEVNFPAVVYIRDQKTKDLLPFRCESTSSCPHIKPSTMVLVRNPWPASLVGDLPSAKDLPRETALSYIVRGHLQRGKFNPQTAIKLGVKPGPAFRVLTDGHPVELSDGSVITPDMVLGPPKPGQGIAIVDLPARGFIDDFIARPEWKNEELMKSIKAMIWITQTDPSIDSQLRSFMDSTPKIEHIIAPRNASPNYLAMESSAISAACLSRIWDEVFPIPIHSQSISRSKAPQAEVAARSNTILAQRGLRVQLEPSFELQMADVPPMLDPEIATNEVPDHVYDLAASARAEISETNDLHDEMEPQLITLGTGSAIPSKYRNVSATLLRIPGQGSYLFDCGENTLGQLRRVFDEKSLNELFLDLKMIWISHLHADHHLGTISVLAAVNQLRHTKMTDGSQGSDTTSPAPLFVVGEENMVGFLDDYSSIERFECVQPVAASPIGMSIDGKPFTFEGTGVPIKKLESCSVSHCYGAQAVAVTFDSGFKISYSGDCRPSENFAKIGARSDLLVHEATFDDGMEGDAMAKKHCTTGEALAVGALMGAKNVILTHFSQRYQKLPVMGDVKLPKAVRFEEGDEAVPEATGPVDEALDEDAPKQPPTYSNAADTVFLDALIAQTLTPEELPPLDMNVCVAFDYMKIKMSQIKQMQKLTPALQALFDVESNGPTNGNMDDAQKNARINRTKVKPGKKTQEVNDQIAKRAKGEANLVSKTQLRKEARRLKHDEIMRNGAKRPMVEGEDEGDSTQTSPSSEKRRRSSETTVPADLLAHEVRRNEVQMKDAAG